MRFFLYLLEKLVDYYFKIYPRKKPKASDLIQTRLVAHRGAHYKKKQIIENTEAAFTEAKKLGCFGIEFDIQITSDNVLVVHHDDDLRRLWRYKFKIRELSFKKLRELVPGILSLHEVVERFGKTLHLFIELKSCSISEELLLADLSELTPSEDYHILSLNECFFKSWYRLPKSALLLVAGHNNVNKLCKTSLKNNYGGVLAHYLLLTDTKIKSLLLKNQVVGVGFVDSKYSLYREVNRNLTWLFTNQAQYVSKYINK